MVVVGFGSPFFLHTCKTDKTHKIGDDYGLALFRQIVTVNTLM
jgi:hypothetical protein